MTSKHKISSLGLVLYFCTIATIYLIGKANEDLQFLLQLVLLISSLFFIFTFRYIKPVDYKLGFDKVIPVYSSFYIYIRTFSFIEIFSVAFSISAIMTPYFGDVRIYKDLGSFWGIEDHTPIKFYTIWATTIYITLTATLIFSLYRRLKMKYRKSAIQNIN